MVPVVKTLGSPCEETVQCSEIDKSATCEENKCISNENVTKNGDTQEESGK
jgi:hypothetical protein